MNHYYNLNKLNQIKTIVNLLSGNSKGKIVLLSKIHKVNLIQLEFKQEEILFLLDVNLNYKQKEKLIKQIKVKFRMS